MLLVEEQPAEWMFREIEKRCFCKYNRYIIKILLIEMITMSGKEPNIKSQTQNRTNNFINCNSYQLLLFLKM